MLGIMAVTGLPYTGPRRCPASVSRLFADGPQASVAVAPAMDGPKALNPSVANRFAASGDVSATDKMPQAWQRQRATGTAGIRTTMRRGQARSKRRQARSLRCRSPGRVVRPRCHCRGHRKP